MKHQEPHPSSTEDYWENIYLHPSEGGEKGGNENVRFAAVHMLLEDEDNTILDMGAGYAQLCRELKVRYPEKVIVAADFSKAAAKASHYKPYVVCDAYNLPFEDNEFDLIISTQLMEYLQYPRWFLSEAKRVASRGIFTVPHGKSDIHNRAYLFDKEYVKPFMEGFGEVEHYEVIGSLIVVKVRFDKDS